MQYYVNEAAFSLPQRPLIDRTLHRLMAPLEGEEDPLAIEIRRVPMDPEKSLREVVAAEHATLSGIVSAETSATSLDGTPALIVRAKLRARDTLYVRLEAHVVFDGTWLAFVVTAPGAHRAACEQTFERLTSGLRWRRT